MKLVLRPSGLLSAPNTNIILNLNMLHCNEDTESNLFASIVLSLLVRFLYYPFLARFPFTIMKNGRCKYVFINQQ